MDLTRRQFIARAGAVMAVGAAVKALLPASEPAIHPSLYLTSNRAWFIQTPVPEGLKWFEYSRPPNPQMLAMLEGMLEHMDRICGCPGWLEGINALKLSYDETAQRMVSEVVRL